MFKPAPLRNSGRRRLKEHQRTENDLLARTSPNEVKQERQRHRSSTRQEQWRKKIQTVLVLPAYHRRAVTSNEVITSICPLWARTAFLSLSLSLLPSP